MDIDKALEAEQGFLVESGPFYTGGTASPVGLDLPTGTLYLQDTASGVLLFRKFGAGVNDWRQLAAQDIPYDVSSITQQSPEMTGLETTREVVDTLADRNFGTTFGIGRFNPNFATTSTTYVDAFVVNIANPKRGRYLLCWSYRSYNSKSNTSSQTQVRFNDAALVTNNLNGTTTSDLGGGLGEQFCGFGEFSILAPANLKLSIAVQRVAGNGTVRVNTMNIYAYRLEYQ